MGNFEEFVTAYITCALWASTDSEGEPLDAVHTVDDITDEAKASMRSDCNGFYHSYDVQRYLAEAYKTGYTDSQAGHDFWLTRNGHGAGFWDRGLGTAGVMLTDNAKAFGSSDLYIGDDFNIHVQ